MRRLFYSISILLSLVLSSCENDVYDFPGDTVNRVYVKSAVNTVNGPDASIYVTRTPLSVDKNSASFSVACTLPSSSELKVTFSVNSSLVDSYNQQKGTSYIAMPSEAVEMASSTLTIPANSTKASEELVVTVSDDAIGDLEKGLYLIALEITGLTGGDAQISTNESVVYMSVNYEIDEDNIYDEVPDASVMGELLSDDRSGWDLIFLNSSFSGAILSAFDGNTGTNLKYEVGELDENTGYVIDMQREYTNISGIYYNYYSTMWGQVNAVTRADIYTSIDNQNWTYQGEVKNSTAFAQPIFYVPVTARYIKTIVLEKTSSVYIRELNIYIKE